jgi:hypothetical protein
MPRSLRPLNLLLVALLASALALVAIGPPASASPERATAAKLKRCKAGGSKKKCRCPAGKRRVKRDGRYRCKKKAAPDNGSDPNTNTDPDPNANPDPNTGTGTPPATVQTQRDDAAFRDALNGTRLRRYEEGSYGYGRYAYNFLPNGQFLYCSYYYAGSTVEANRGGTWEVVEGHVAPAYPGYTIGVVRIAGPDFDARIGVEMYNEQSNVESGNVSSTFTEGAFTRTIGGAVTNCSAIE